MKKLLIVVCFLLLSVPVYAQHPAHPEIVVEVKQILTAMGANLTGPCGAFQITKRVAWLLASEGIGLLSKPNGNNCDGYSVDFITYLDGSGVDILGDAGNANIPGWEMSEPVGALVGRWRAPINPAPGSNPDPIPIPIPAPIFSDTEILRRLAVIENEVLIVKAEGRLTLNEIKAHRDGVQRMWTRVAAIAGPIVTGVITWVSTR